MSNLKKYKMRKYSVNVPGLGKEDIEEILVRENSTWDTHTDIEIVLKEGVKKPKCYLSYVMAVNVNKIEEISFNIDKGIVDIEVKLKKPDIKININ